MLVDATINVSTFASECYINDNLTIESRTTRVDRVSLDCNISCIRYIFTLDSVKNNTHTHIFFRNTSNIHREAFHSMFTKDYLIDVWRYVIIIIIIILQNLHVALFDLKQSLFLGYWSTVNK